MTRYFIDAEFFDDGAAVDLLSIGIVREDGESRYWQHAGFDFDAASEWVVRNVFPHLEQFSLRTQKPLTHPGPVPNKPIPALPWRRRSEIRDGVRAFVESLTHTDPAIELWGYFCGFDFVVLSQLFGPLGSLPSNWPFLMYDLRQALDERGLHDVRQPNDAPHHALRDAEWIHRTYMEHIAGTPLPDVSKAELDRARLAWNQHALAEAKKVAG